MGEIRQVCRRMKEERRRMRGKEEEEGGFKRAQDASHPAINFNSCWKVLQAAGAHGEQFESILLSSQGSSMLMVRKI